MKETIELYYMFNIISCSEYVLLIKYVNIPWE